MIEKNMQEKRNMWYIKKRVSTLRPKMFWARGILKKKMSQNATKSFKNITGALNESLL